MAQLFTAKLAHKKQIKNIKIAFINARFDG
jgi:hypothetical protein